MTAPTTIIYSNSGFPALNQTIGFPEWSVLYLPNMIAKKFIVPVILIGNRISQKFYTKKQPQTD